MKITAVGVDHLADKTIRFNLECGHVIRGDLPPLNPGDEYACPQCAGAARHGIRPATPEQLERAVAEYRALMEAQGVTFPPSAQDTLMRAARIHDAWRVAFKRAGA